MTGNVSSHLRVLTGAAVVAGMVGALPASTHAAATIVILNNNAAGVGFNDPTPAAPVGGNPGTTLGQQRLNAFAYAASIWGAQLNSSVTIVVRAQMTPLTCTATSAVLGSAGPVSAVRDFTNVPLPSTWYHVALANALAGADLVPANPDINANFNSNLGQPNCLAGSPFYLGLDGNHGTAIDLPTVLLHEFGHGLGFSTLTSGTTGNYFNGFPAAYDHFLYDNTQNLTWVQMTAAQRAASAINPRRVGWTGANVGAALPGVLQLGTPELTATAPSSVAGTYLVGTANFGAPLTGGGLTGEVMPVVDQANGTGLACTPLSPANALSVNGKVAMVDRGTCTFPEKVKNVQNAGAIAAIVVDNAAGSPPPGMGGVDPTITIPSVRVSLADGNAFKTAMRNRSRTRSGLFVNMYLNMAVYSGADANGRALIFTPNPFQSGSSVSHWDTIAFPNQLMEPSINADLTHSVAPPQDLTLPMMKDIGWP